MTTHETYFSGMPNIDGPSEDEEGLTTGSSLESPAYAFAPPVYEGVGGVTRIGEGPEWGAMLRLLEDARAMGCGLWYIATACRAGVCWSAGAGKTFASGRNSGNGCCNSGVARALGSAHTCKSGGLRERWRGGL